MNIRPAAFYVASLFALSLPCAADSVAGSPAQWTLTAADGTLSEAMDRWARIAGYQIVWQAPKDLPAYAVTYLGDFEFAIESLMRDTQSSGYPLHACLYDNKVVRVLHATQACAR